MSELQENDQSFDLLYMAKKKFFYRGKVILEKGDIKSLKQWIEIFEKRYLCFFRKGRFVGYFLIRQYFSPCIYKDKHLSVHDCDIINEMREKAIEGS